MNFCNDLILQQKNTIHTLIKAKFIIIRKYISNCTQIFIQESHTHASIYLKQILKQTQIYLSACHYRCNSHLLQMSPTISVYFPSIICKRSQTAERESDFIHTHAECQPQNLSKSMAHCPSDHYAVKTICEYTKRMDSIINTTSPD